ncbi:phosphopentomutase [Acetonema longum]|uniref:Phosphopentomutase n=1 Tax=Acetonema longum DSM 6540 TaxID=1009370 RepID=F7NJZ7_9FIRM|nr:phosphopentomutase [Acetonema longum DSM 6540]
MFTRVIVIVLDSVGIGATPDAHLYGDSGTNTLVHIAEARGGLLLPVLESLGLGCIEAIPGVKRVNSPKACYAKMAELSKGKDTTSGHWEIAGYPVFSPFPMYPQGFPAEMIDSFVRFTGKKILGNKPASGTEIIQELGAEHMVTGYPIVYTSGDSVFQIAAHEEIIPPEELYDICRIARKKVCIGPHAVGRVIARPFVGQPGRFTRTAGRHDFSLEPGQTVLDSLKEHHYTVVGVGKIGDIFAHRGLTDSYPTVSNSDGMNRLHAVLAETSRGLVMVNLVDFDSLYGHRNDAAGYAEALEEFDRHLALLLPAIRSTDLLIITADHGCDPTMPGTDHTREYVPLLAFSPARETGLDLGIRTSFADIGATIAEIFHLPGLEYGQSFLPAFKEN